MVKTTFELIEIFKKKFITNWLELKPLGLVSPYFPNTFNPSGGHNIVQPVMLDSLPKQVVKFYTIERCFRDIDIGIVGISHHLSFFEMLTFGAAGYIKDHPNILEDTVKTMSDLLFNSFNLEPEKVFVAYFNGGTFANTYVPPPSDEELEIWKNNFRLHLIPIPGRRTFIYSNINNWPAGAGFEIFYDRGEAFPEPVRFIEIASVNCYKYLNRSGFLHEAENWAVGGGIGLERLSMILQKALSIYDIDIFTELINTLDGRAGKEELWLFRKSYNIVLDHLRAIGFILMDGQQIDPSPRGKILKRLIKQTINQLSYLNLLDEKLIDNFYNKISLLYENRYPYLRDQKSNLIETIKRMLLC